jgi:DNA (cytosine-5)-methyltransferase 1
MGYHRAGFEVVGVDIKPQKNYPFEFHQGDAMTWPLDGFDAIHASPPCQHYSAITQVHGQAVIDSHPDLVEATRERLVKSGAPYVIENVVGAPLLGHLLLCGTMFAGLEVRRHRIFEGDVPVFGPASCNHSGYAVPVYGHSGAGANRGRERERGRSNGVADWARAMGIDWMTGHELAESIPPAYTEYIGKQLMVALNEKTRTQAGLEGDAE